MKRVLETVCVLAGAIFVQVWLHQKHQRTMEKWATDTNDQLELTLRRWRDDIQRGVQQAQQARRPPTLDELKQAEGLVRRR